MPGVAISLIEEFHSALFLFSTEELILWQSNLCGESDKNVESDQQSFLVDSCL